MPSKGSSIAELERLVPLAEAAELIGVSPRMVSKLVQTGHIARSGRGQYRVMDVCQGYIRHMTEKRDKAIAARAADDAYDTARARLVWHQVKKLEAKLVDMEDVEAVSRFFMRVYREEMAGAFDGLPPDIAAKANAYVEAAFTRHEKRHAEAMAAFRGGRDPLEDTVGDDE